MSVIIHPIGASRSCPVNGGSQQIVSLINSFGDFPSGVPVDKFLLARSGFYYSGYGDRVVCSSCSVAVANWQPGDDGDLARFHKPHCPYHNGFHSNDTSFGNCNAGKSAGDLLMNGFGSFPPYRPNHNSYIAAPSSDTHDIGPQTSQLPVHFTKMLEQC